MANHLRELAECISRRDIEVNALLSEQHIHAAMLIAEKRAQRAICFDAGAIDSFHGLRIIDELSVLPYDDCWFECDRIIDGYQVTLGVLASKIENGFDALVFTRLSDGWCYSFFFRTEVGKSQSDAVGIDSKNSGEVEMAKMAIGFVRAFLSALNCTNVRRVEHKPDAKLQKARAKRGKQPLFSYWTLELDLSRPESSERLGGTHASPRLHLRRGHPRQYAAGKWTWVQPCVVGNKAAGMIHKDYALVTQ